MSMDNIVNGLVNAGEWITLVCDDIDENHIQEMLNSIDEAICVIRSLQK